LRKLPKEELHNLYSSPNILGTKKSRRMRWAGHVARTKEAGNIHRVLIGKQEKRPVGGPRQRMEVKVKKVKISLLRAVEAHRVARG
jgi:hypothetical protein